MRAEGSQSGMELAEAYNRAPVALWRSLKRNRINSEIFPSPGQYDPLSANPDQVDPVKTPPVPWSLTWCEDGELGTQDLFDLLQVLVANESNEVQLSLISAVEQLTLNEFQVMACEEVTRMCA